jgi:hypothetical protein
MQSACGVHGAACGRQAPTSHLLHRRELELQYAPRLGVGHIQGVAGARLFWQGAAKGKSGARRSINSIETAACSEHNSIAAPSYQLHNSMQPVLPHTTQCMPTFLQHTYCTDVQQEQCPPRVALLTTSCTSWASTGTLVSSLPAWTRAGEGVSALLLCRKIAERG